MKTFSVACAIIVSAASTSPIAQRGDASPTLGETKAWLEIESVPMMHATDLGDGNIQATITAKYSVTSLKLDDCKLVFVVKSEITNKFLGRPDTIRSIDTQFTVPLKDVDTGGVVPDATAMFGPEPLDEVRIPLRADRGKTIQTTRRDGPPGLSNSTVIFVRNKVDATRIATAIRRAAVLCGSATSVF